MRQRITKPAKLRKLAALLLDQCGDRLHHANVRGGTGHRVDLFGGRRDISGARMRYHLWPGQAIVEVPLNPLVSGEGAT